MRPTVHLVAARGGHLELLQRLRGALEPFDRIWVTERSERAEALAADGERVEFISHFGRSPRRAMANVRAAARLVRETKPRVVVCSGSGVTVPFCTLARFAGARVVFAETMARITGPSMSGRVLSRLAGDVLVQWPEMADVYRGATVCRPALLEGVAGLERSDGSGTFVAVGTWHQPFDRLLETVDAAAARGLLPQPIVAQSGVSTYRPRHFEATSFMEPAALESAVMGAELVICHAGSGIISSALRSGRRPLVLPRRAQHGEHVDDHQLQLAGRLAGYGFATLVGNEITEADVIASTTPLPAEPPAIAGGALAEVLAARLGVLADGAAAPAVALT